MAFCDFVVRHDPAKEIPQDLTRKILYSIWIKRVKARKPAIIFVSGDSGEGKSWGTLTLEELLLELQGINPLDVINDINIYIPTEYPDKMRRLLFAKELKKVNILAIHEAREVVKAKKWHTFLAQSIADINASTRSIKPLIVFIVSQFIRDITTDIRYTLNYYVTARRPKGKPTRLYINVMWKNDRDLDKPKLCRRKLSGYIVSPDGKYQRFVPKYLDMRRPSKSILEEFEKRDWEAKAKIIKSKTAKLINEMKADMGAENEKVDAMVDWYATHPEQLPLIGKRVRGRWKANDKVRAMHDMNDEEVKDFATKMNERLKEIGIIEGDVT